MEVHEDEVQALQAFAIIEELNHAFAVPFAFKSAVQLRIPDILAAAGPGASLTAQQIADKLPRNTANSARTVGRILRLLAHKGVFAESQGPTSTDSDTEARYGLTNVSKYLTTGSEFDFQPFVLMMQKTEEYAFLNYLREVVEEDANAFKLAFGVDDPWSLAKADPERSARFYTAMNSWSKLHNSVLAHHYDGFKDVKCLVDVGGAVGHALAIILAAHPHISGINFDLPHVISTAPDIPGVKHVSGSFLESVPPGDAMLCQYVLHNWGDDDCIKILKNCYQALSDKGKLLVRENVIDPARSSAAKTSSALNSDILMMACYKGVGGERTSAEYKRLLSAAGFSHVSFLSVLGWDLIECVKT